jgi:integrase
MHLKLYRPKGSLVWSYRGTLLPGDRLRGTTRTESRKIATQIVRKIEEDYWKRHLDGPQAVLTFPTAVQHYLSAGKSERFIAKLEDHWKDAKVKDMTAGAIRQSAVDIYPNANGATRNRQVITPTQAIINHCAELELCPPIRIKRFKSDKKIKKPVTVAWLDTFCAHARPQMAALAVFMFATGCRISEARRIEWSDIDFQQCTIQVRKTKAKQDRLPHMPQRLLVALANLPRDKKPFHWSESSLRRFWDEDIEKTAAATDGGFERLTFHCCRHGLATKLLRDKVDVKTASVIAGMSVAVMLSTYAHAMQDQEITEGIFDNQLTRAEAAKRKINDL